LFLQRCRHYFKEAVTLWPKISFFVFDCGTANDTNNYFAPHLRVHSVNSLEYQQDVHRADRQSSGLRADPASGDCSYEV
jgi:hypothetical protein